ncbi:MAG: hypothetical protein ACRYFU_15860 [Janthinobacterium lividum]
MPDAQEWPDDLDTQEWPGGLDALIAAPQHHVLLFENESVRVLDITVAAGDIVPLHTHRWPGILYLRSWSDCVRRDADGAVMMDSRTSTNPSEGTAFWSPAMRPHTLENIGNSVLHVIGVELKNVE